MTIRLRVRGVDRALALDQAVVAGFTGRDRAEVDRHVEELRALGVPTPERVPAFYDVPPDCVCQQGAVAVGHGETSGEAEVALVGDGEERLVTLASDHTDRRAETTDIALSKRACPKPIADRAWRYADVVDHWDVLRLRSWIEEEGELRLYQEGTLGSLLAPPALLDLLPAPLLPRFALLCGTVPVRGEIRGSSCFRAELRDPISGDAIRLDYRVRVSKPRQQEVA